MTARSGEKALLQLGDGGAPPSYTSIGGVQITQMQLTARPEESAEVCLSPWRVYATTPVKRQAAIGVKGVFLGTAAEYTLMGYAASGAPAQIRLVLSSGLADERRIGGSFYVTAYTRMNDITDADHYALTLESSGEVTIGTV